MSNEHESANSTNNQNKECPFCGETIKAKAIKCRFCGSDLVTTTSSISNQSTINKSTALENQNAVGNAPPLNPEHIDVQMPVSFATVTNFTCIVFFFVLSSFFCIGSAIYYMVMTKDYVYDFKRLSTFHHSDFNERYNAWKNGIGASDEAAREIAQQQVQENEREYNDLKKRVSMPKEFFWSLGIFGIANFIYFIFFCTIIYKSWSVIQDGFAQTTPGKAVGLLFIPFFNFYWLFVAFYDLSINLNKYSVRHKLNFEYCKSGLIFIICILWVMTCVMGFVPFVSPSLAILLYFLNFIAINSIHRIIRFLLCIKAAEQGDAIAQCELGIYYGQRKFRGSIYTVIPENIEEAVKWWNKAAKQGNEEAIKLLEKVGDCPNSD